MINVLETVNFTRVYKYIEKYYSPYILVVDKAFKMRNVLTYVELVSYIAENIGDTLTAQHRIAEFLYNNCIDMEVY